MNSDPVSTADKSTARSKGAENAYEYGRVVEPARCERVGQLLLAVLVERPVSSVPVEPRLLGEVEVAGGDRVHHDRAHDRVLVEREVADAEHAVGDGEGQRRVRRVLPEHLRHGELGPAAHDGAHLFRVHDGRAGARPEVLGALGREDVEVVDTRIRERLALREDAAGLLALVDLERSGEASRAVRLVLEEGPLVAGLADRRPGPHGARNRRGGEEGEGEPERDRSGHRPGSPPRRERSVAFASATGCCARSAKRCADRAASAARESSARAVPIRAAQD